MLDAKMDRGHPHVETLIFLSDENVRIDLQGAARAHMVTRANFVRAVQFDEFPGSESNRPRPRIDRPTAQRLAETLKAIGIKKSTGALRVGPYALGTLIEDGTGYQ